MATHRIEQLLQFLSEDPHDPFTLYALATEYRATDVPQALRYYEKLLQEHPNYVGTYYHAAKLYAEIGEFGKAEQVFQQGITVSRAAGDRNALRELQNAYREFEEERDDA